MISEVKHNGIAGYFIPLDHPAVNLLLRHGVISRHKSAIKKGYPKLFEDFWEAYHPDRRKEKKLTFSAWTHLSVAHKTVLPHAAAAYTDYILVESEPKYMKHSKRFITSYGYEDYINKSRQSTTIVALEYWDTCIKSVLGFSTACKPEDRQLAVEDIRRLSPKLWHDKVWIFFFGRDEVINSQKAKLGIHYKTFHSMLPKELLNTRVKKPVPCKHCGKLGGQHEENCTILIEKRIKEDKVTAEYEEGKALSYDLKSAFNKKVGREKKEKHEQDN